MFQPILAPTDCPSCASTLVFKNDILYCVNDSCEAKSLKALSHWSTVLKIKGLGPKSIEKLEISSLEDLYELTNEDLELALGSKNGNKVFLEIERSKSLPLNITLSGFNIPLIGKSATEKLSLIMSSINEFTEDTMVKAGLGPKAIENLLEWYYCTYLERFKNVLPLNFTFEKQNKPKTSKGIVCISGKLNSFKAKAQAESALKAAGYIVKSSVTKDTTILINEGGVDSAKTKKAEELGINIITDINLILGE
jgi:DNA ligase (NAD+)